MPRAKLQAEMPWAEEAEVAVLGAILARDDAIAAVAHLLEPEAFYLPAHQAVYEPALALFRRGSPVNVITVTEALRAAGRLDDVGGMAYLSELLDAAPPGSAGNLEHYAGMIRDRAVLRELIQAGREIQQHALGANGDGADAVLDACLSRLFRAAERRHDRGVVPVADLVMPTLEVLEREDRGLMTGFADLDRMTWGMQPGDLWLVAARPSMGKTSLAVQILAHAAIRERVPCVFFSLEMSSTQVVTRMLSAVARVNVRDAARRGDSMAANRLAWAASEISQAPIYIDDAGSLGVTELRAKSRLAQIRAGGELGLIVVDYIQLMRGEGAESRVQEVSEISRGLKLAAKEFGCPVLALSQLSRAPEGRSDYRPRLSDLRDSGSLEQDADTVLFLYRPEYYFGESHKGEDLRGRAELIVGKQRNGPTGKVELYFRKEFTLFEDLEKRREYDAA